MPERAFQPSPRQNISRLQPALNHFRAALLLPLLTFVPLCATAQNEAPSAASKAAVRITFLPPPIDGTLSLGIYDKSGKLARTLHREAEAEKDFTVGLNGLITVWDGKDDAGQAVPAGKYAARGYAVGEVQIEGVAMHCNDWITDDDSPRVARMISFSSPSSSDAEDIGVNVILASGTSATLHVTPTGKIRSFEPRAFKPEDLPDERPRDAFHHETRIGDTKYAIRSGQLVKSTSSAPWQELKLPGLVSAIFFCTTRADPAGVDFWIIDQTPAGHEVKLYNEAGEFKRRLSTPTDQPQPFALSANRDSTTLGLLEQKQGVQRFRILQIAHRATTNPSAPDQKSDSIWEVTASIEIAASDTFQVVAEKLGRNKAFVPEEKIRVRLLPNELLKGATSEIDVQISVDHGGTLLKSADGLPLLRITETPNLKWAVMGREGGKVVTIFQSDGAVVEEFKARKLASMMAFDAGEYEWSPGK